MKARIRFSTKNLDSFCRKYKVRELSFFGSVLGNDFKAKSDVDVLISFLPNTEPTLVDLDEMRRGLEGLFSRKVDLIEAEAIRNPYRRYSILKHREKFYAA